MVEREALLSIRETIMENLQQPRAESLQEELIDEVRAIDRQLGANALFILSCEAYQAPLPQTAIEYTAPTYQAETLF